LRGRGGEKKGGVPQFDRLLVLPGKEGKVTRRREGGIRGGNTRIPQFSPSLVVTPG